MAKDQEAKKREAEAKRRFIELAKSRIRELVNKVPRRTPVGAISAPWISSAPWTQPGLSWHPSAHPSSGRRWRVLRWRVFTDD